MKRKVEPAETQTPCVAPVSRLKVAVVIGQRDIQTKEATPWSAATRQRAAAPGTPGLAPLLVERHSTLKSCDKSQHSKE
jgi:hypothetical protein